MYKDIGKKIKYLAMTIGLLGTLVCLIAGIALLADDTSRNDVLGGIYMGGAVLFFVASWPLYGFGKLVDDVGRIKKQLQGSKLNQNKAFEDELPNL